MGKAIAMKGCTITATVSGNPLTGNLSVETEAEDNVFLSSGSLYFGDIDVKVPANSTVPSTGATLKSDVTITITATGKLSSTSKGKALLLGDKSSGLDTGSFQIGDKTSSLPILLTITDAGQDLVTT